MSGIADRLAPEAVASLEEGSFSDDELLAGESTSLNAFFDLANARRLTQTLWFFVCTLGIYALVGFVDGSPVRGAVAGLALVVDLLLLRHRHRPAVSRNIRQVSAAVLIGHLVALQLFHGAAAGGIGGWFALLPLIATRFRLASGETAALFASLYAVIAVRLVGESLLTRQSQPFLSLALYALLFIACFAGSWGASRRLEGRFVTRWRSEAARHRDRLRMKRELEYAREIQLGMLPRDAPRLPWLDVAALSLPATEVGGDYYDYFLLAPDRLAIVVGDVTGHGVASGLVLSGVRSSLNLLRDELDAPAAVLGRVNLMLKRTSAPRMNMTLAVVVLDGARGRGVVAAAGHPPPLLRRAGGGVLEVGAGSFPLGAIADAAYTEERIGLAAGDLLVLFSDGVVETIDPEGRQFGWERLIRLLEGLEGEPTAKEVRDLVLREVWDFKASADQVDDVTIVVARWTAASSGGRAG
ncbi:MAG: PP2C family protein-serine/threonine phosphatase [Thermoanaerobaculales bacterium]|jgi:hypothetical protein|nr:PP2C family protein-serine/threonine phosphatase [Thermoanaerobaculales bacterium]